MERNTQFMEICLKVNLKMEIKKDMEYYIILMGIDMKEDLKIIQEKVLEYCMRKMLNI